MTHLASATAPLLVGEPLGGRALLAMHGVTKDWGQRRILDGVDLEIAPGELVRLDGSNGAGKTTLLRIATGMITPDAGRVTLDQLNPERDRREFLRRIGFVSAGDRGLYPRLSARRHLRFASSLALLPRSDQDAAIDQMIDVFELGEFVERRVDRLSTGQRQRVRLATSLVHAPKFVVLDEPANSLDEDGIGVLNRFLSGLRHRGGGAVWTAPSGAHAPLEFDRNLRLTDGNLITR